MLHRDKIKPEFWGFLLGGSVTPDAVLLKLPEENGFSGYYRSIYICCYITCDVLSWKLYPESHPLKNREGGDQQDQPVDPQGPVDGMRN